MPWESSSHGLPSPAVCRWERTSLAIASPMELDVGCSVEGLILLSPLQRQHSCEFSHRFVVFPPHPGTQSAPWVSLRRLHPSEV